MQSPLGTRLVFRFTVAALLAGAVACGDQPTRPGAAPEASVLSPEAQQRLLTASPSCNVSRIYTLVTALAPVPLANPTYSLGGAVTITLSLVPWQLALAQQWVIAVATTLARPDIQAQLNGTTAVKLTETAELTNLLFGCVGLPTTNIRPGAFGPGGTVTTIGPAGGTAITLDKHAGLSLPAGAVTSNHLIAIAPVVTDPATPNSCVTATAGVTQLGRCYELTITPADPLIYDDTHPVIAALCSMSSEDPLHDNLRISKQHLDAAPVIYSFVLPPATLSLVCDSPLGMAAPSTPLGERLFGSAWPTMAGALAFAARPFEVTPAFAFDGVGGNLCEARGVCALSRATIVSTTGLAITPAVVDGVAPNQAVSFSVAGPPGMLGLGSYVWSVNGAVGGSALDGTITSAGTYTTPSEFASSSIRICVGAPAAMARPPAPACATVSPGIVTSVSTSVSPASYTGTCPAVFAFTGSITARAPGPVTYTWEWSDGGTGPGGTVTFAEPGTQLVSTTWTLSPAQFTGWGRLRIVTPNALVSNSAAFSLVCTPS